MNKAVVADTKPAKVNLEAGKKYFYCTCGQSSKQPFCDGSHKNTELTPQAFTAEKDGDAFLCQCKQSGNAPYCDGSHKNVSVD